MVTGFFDSMCTIGQHRRFSRLGEITDVNTLIEVMDHYKIKKALLSSYPDGWKAVSYTHLTLLTIYSV